MLDVHNPRWVSEGVSYTERTVTTRDGVALSVREYGSRATADHTVVLLHGLCHDQSSWDAPRDLLLRQEGRKARVITYDHRGHGASGRAPIHTYRIDQLARDLADVLTAMEITGPLTLAGHSMGGMTALTYLGLPASQRPADPVNVVLIATAAGKIVERGVGRLLATPAVRLACGLVHRLPTSRTPLTPAAGFLTSMRDYDVYATLGAVCAQTTIISGGLDVITPSAHADDMAERIPGAAHFHVARAGHMLLDEIPDVVSAAIGDAITAETIVTGDSDLADVDAAVAAAFRAQESAKNPPRRPTHHFPDRTTLDPNDIRSYQ